MNRRVVLHCIREPKLTHDEITEFALGMSETFDPYLEWLGIRRNRSGVNHYRLLGLEPFESDVQVIANAAQRQISHVKTVADKERESVGKKLIAELMGARDCLLDSELKLAYDRKLKKAASQNGSEVTPKVVVGENRGEPDFSKMQLAEEGPGVPVESRAAPKIAVESGRGRRRKKKSSAFDVLGWLLGAVGAVVFAWVLLNTDLIERIKGTAVNNSDATSEKVGDEEPNALAATDGDSDKPKIEKTKPSSDASRRKSTEQFSKGRVANDISNKSPRNSDSETVQIKTRRPVGANRRGSASNPSRRRTMVKRKVTSLPKVDVPDAKSIARAVADLRGSFSEQFKNDDARSKRKLADSLLNNAREQTKSDVAYAMIKTSSDLSAEMGRLEPVVDALRVMDRRFEIDFWTNLKPVALKAISNCRRFEDISEDFEDLIHEARAGEALELCADLVSEAARLTKKQGDDKQVELLLNFGRDLKAMIALKRDYEQLTKKTAVPRTKVEHLTFGKYFCFVKQDWEKGLTFLAKGSDMVLAKAAAAELSYKDKDQSLVLGEWVSIAKNKKSKGVDRRGILERVQEKLDEGHLPELDTLGMQRELISLTQFVKKYVDAHDARQRVVRFGKITIGNKPLGTVELERGHTLVIRQGGPAMYMSVRKTGVDYTTATKDGRLKFRIRFMDNGFAEMRITDTSTKRWTLWYGN